MCVVSFVMDEYRKPFGPYFPKPYNPGPMGPTPEETAEKIKILINGKTDLQRLSDLIDKFEIAVSKAESIDVLTGQPDCVDPEKAQLKERVAFLEKVVDKLLLEKTGG